MSSKQVRANSEIVVGGGNSSRFKMPHFRKPTLNKRRAIIGVSIVLILGIGALLFIKQYQPDLIGGGGVFRIEDKVYSEAEVSELIAYPLARGADRDESARAAYDFLVRQAAANKSGLGVDNNRLQSAKDRLVEQGLFASDVSLDEPWVRLVVTDAAIEDSLTSGGLDTVSGYVYQLYFGEQATGSSEYTPDNFGNEEIIKADREYAEQKAEEFRTALLNETLSKDEVLEAITADARLSIFNRVGGNYSAKLDPNNPLEEWRYTLMGDEVVAFISEAPLGVSEIGTLTAVAGDVENSEGERTEVAFIFTAIEDKGSLADNEEFIKNVDSISARFTGFKS